ncbi:hypothetical protein GCM10023194_12440 [Planotetraspora phitsanulokensis]|uniref:Calcium-binding protein n=1 Tax=Planotetraspora phitsanulokensis TaxID=575192 RepID=A0A8J3UCX4_9ACTN|nr:hypothetical protein [Planotetraspora phitsanulokensis]GII41337.1 hypothetical protein Pph01_63400 [Planotetraspora phitsanulokensis]
MKRVRVRKSRALQALALTAFLSASLVSPLSPTSAAEAAAAVLPSPPLPAATIAVYSGSYGDNVWPADGRYNAPTISADGNTIAYTYTDWSPVHSDYNAWRTHGIVLNRKTGTSVWLPDLNQEARVQLSEDGSKAVYLTRCRASCGPQLYVRDIATGVETRLDVPDGTKQNSVGAVSYDGARTVVYRSGLPQVPGAGSNQWYLRDLVSGDVKLLRDPHAPAYIAGLTSFGSAVSPGGRFIAISWMDASGEWVSVHDQVTGTYTRVTQIFSGAVHGGFTSIGGISNSGKLAFITEEQLVPEDTDTFADAYVKDLVTGTVTLAPLQGSVPVDATITANGRYMLYRQDSTGYVLWNLETDTRRFLTGMDGQRSSVWGDSNGPVLSRDGRYLATRTSTEVREGGIALRDQAQDCAGDFATITGSGTIYGSPGDDVIYGSPGSDTVYGYGGNDVICGMGGDDVIDGGPGADALYGGDGDDRIEGNEGDDVVEGGVGADSMNGGTGTDALLYRYATSGVDVSLQRVTPNGMPGEGDQVFNDFDQIYGTAYDDTISGSDAGDTLVGMGGDDLLLGQGGDDRLWADVGNDVLVGMAGDDYLNGGYGTDSCAGGTGTNTFADCTYTSNVS